MTVEQADPDPARGLRRLLGIGFLLALVGAGVALGIFLSRGSPATKPSIFPAQFAESGFVSGPIRLDTSYDAGAGESRVTGKLPAGRTSYVVALCDHGGVVVTAGSLTTSQPCTGKPVGVVTLRAAHTEQLTATVSRPQTNRWGIAIYR